MTLAQMNQILTEQASRFQETGMSIPTTVHMDKGSMEFGEENVKQEFSDFAEAVSFLQDVYGPTREQQEIDRLTAQIAAGTARIATYQGKLDVLQARLDVLNGV